ncbi:MAG: hypothetical protein LBH43_17215, partial [Treponema sp.]|nr:hypothetical protein [Treponema sp.]
MKENGFMDNVGALERAVKWKRVRDVVFEVIRYILLTFWLVFALFPLFWMALMTLKSDAEVVTTVFKFTPTAANYQAVLFRQDSNYILAFVQNFIVSGGAILLTLIVGVPAAYAFARYDFKN